MKTKIISVILAAALLLTLAACGKNKGAVSDSDNVTSGKKKSTALDWKPEVPERELLQTDEYMCGVYYMDYSYEDFSGMKKNRKYYNKIFKSTGTLKKFPFLKSIPDENIVSTPMGAEVYLIIPADSKAKIDVYLMSFDEDMFTTQRSEKPIYSSKTGNPIVLQCNYGDLFSDAEIVITDSEGQELIWSPSISLKDGRVNNKAEDGKTVYDFTEYEVDEDTMDD